jgi:ADP-ribosylglycohydrolase
MPLSPSQLHGALYGHFIGDALALGPHWIYHRHDLQARCGRVEHYLDPATPYHPEKKAGDQTHLGDQSLILAESLTQTSPKIQAADFMTRWRDFWEQPNQPSYQDKATKHVLAQLQKRAAYDEAAAPSSEMAGAARATLAALAGLAYGWDDERILATAVEHAQLTHRSEESAEATQLWTRLMLQLAAGQPLTQALNSALTHTTPVLHRALESWREARSVTDDDLPTLVESTGQSCDIADALPSSLLILERQAAHPREALIDNVMSGGDSATRGLIIGTVIGLIHGPEAWPTSWKNELSARSRIEQLLHTLS